MNNFIYIELPIGGVVEIKCKEPKYETVHGREGYVISVDDKLGHTIRFFDDSEITFPIENLINKFVTR